ncbi:hypothetical protein QAD02_004574 [Eretmocerus hayati]|uniref:Uncharacterized protein n=1 Tax=Eretmocerus hayati TaxID=131215 RepID=A0ACC2NQC1_9HYME|nr:hypothetical protein QAD02_004574 [Eretmocerus hayati]
MLYLSKEDETNVELQRAISTTHYSLIYIGHKPEKSECTESMLSHFAPKIEEIKSLVGNQLFNYYLVTMEGRKIPHFDPGMSILEDDPEVILLLKKHNLGTVISATPKEDCEFVATRELECIKRLQYEGLSKYENDRFSP